MSLVPRQGTHFDWNWQDASTGVSAIDWAVAHHEWCGGKMSHAEIAESLSSAFDFPLTEGAVRLKMRSLGHRRGQTGNGSEDVRERLLAMIRKGRTSVVDLADALDLSPSRVRAAAGALVNDGYLITLTDTHAALDNAPQVGSFTPIDPAVYDGERVRFGVVADNHLCSKYQRLDVLHALYDVYEREGIRAVYNAGNWIDGEARFNKQDLLIHGMDNQVRYFVDNYPERDGVQTYYVAGDDHEGWYVQQTGIDIGKHVERVAQEEGRSDLHYLGYMEADVSLSNGAKIRVAHPGGGSAYALSYQPQKLVESLSGGEKPAIYIGGHYHKALYLYYRGVHVLLAGTTCDQSPFMRKRNLAAHLGGWIVECNLCDEGVNRVKCEWLTAYDLGYTEENWAYVM